MKRMRLTKEEKEIEDALLRGEYKPVSKAEFDKMSRMLAETRRRKDAVLNIRVNRQDLDRIREKAKKAGIPYQTLIGEVIHHLAMQA